MPAMPGQVSPRHFSRSGGSAAAQDLRYDEMLPACPGPRTALPTSRHSPAALYIEIKAYPPVSAEVLRRLQANGAISSWWTPARWTPLLWFGPPPWLWLHSKLLRQS